MNLKITNISKTNLNGIGALKNVMFNTPNGTYGLIRSNGTGKSALTLFSLLLLTAVIVLLIGANAYAQDKTSDIDKIFSWATPAAPGVCMRRLAKWKGDRKLCLRLCRPRTRRSIEPKLDLRCRVIEEAICRRSGPTNRPRWETFPHRRCPQACSPVVRLRPQDHT